MAVAVGSTSSIAFGTRTNTTVTAPTSIANGDLLLAIVYAGDSGDATAPTVTGPAGFTKVTGSPVTINDGSYAAGLNVFWKIAASEAGNYTFTHTAASSQAFMYRLTGPHATTPLSPTMTTNICTGGGSVVPTVSLSLTTTSNNTFIIHAASLWDGGPGTIPSGTTPTFTERYDSGALYVADGTLATAGATGNKTSTHDAQNPGSPSATVQIAVTPADPSGGGGDGTTPPAFRAVASTSYTSRSNTSVSKPTGTVDNDIMVMSLALASSTSQAATLTLTPPAGWTKFGTAVSQTQGGGGFHGALHVYWKRAASEGSSYAFSHTTMSSQAVITSYSGCLASGSPIDVFSQRAALDTAAAATSITPTVANTKLVLHDHGWDVAASTPPSGMTERFDNMITAHDETWVTPGTTGTRSHVVNGGSNPTQSYLIALKPVPTVVAYSLTAVAGSYALTGSSVTALHTWKPTAVAGSYALTGTPTATVHAWKPTAVAGSYALTGTPVTLSTLVSQPVFRAVSSIVYASRTATTVDKPVGTANGDILLAAFFQAKGGDIPIDATAPPGWSQIGTNLQLFADGLYTRFSLWWRRASSEGATYTWDHSGQAQFTQLAISAYSGCVVAGNPVDVFSQNSGDSSTGGTATATGVTTTVANTVLVYGGHNWDNTQVLSPPSGMTERFDQLVYFADEARATAGATSNRLQAGVGMAWAACLVALKPASGALAYTLEAVSGSYSLTGTPATPKTISKLSAVSGSYSLTGTATTLSKSGSPMPIFRALSSIPYTQRVTSTVITKPTGTVDGDVMVMTFMAGRPDLAALVVDTFPTGWTQVGTQSVVTAGGFYVRIHVWWKRAAGEGADYTFLHANSLWTEATIVTYAGAVASGNPIDAFSQNGANTGSTATATGVTSTGNTKLIYTGHNWDGGGTRSPPTGMAERYDNLVYSADQDWPNASATGDRTQTLATSNPWQVFLVALKGGPTVTSTYTVTAVSGSYSLTGTTAAVGRGLIAQAGSYSFTGSIVSLRTVGSKGLIATPGRYALSGSPVTLTRTAIGGMNVWTGSAWADKPVKVWTGSAWLKKPVKVWNGSGWT